MNVVAPAARAALNATALVDVPAKQRVLFMVDGRATLEQQAIMIEALERTGRWASYLLANGFRLEPRDIPVGATAWGSEGTTQANVDAASATIGHVAPANRTERRWHPLRHPTMAIPRELVSALVLAARWRRERTDARKRLQSLAPSCVVTAQSRTETVLPIVAAAADLGIPVILAPTAGLYMPDGGAYMRRRQGSFSLDHAPGSVSPSLVQQLLNRLVGWIWPDQLFLSRWGRMLYRPAHWYLAGHLASLCPSRAWFSGTRFVDAVVVSGDDERYVCERAGIPESRLAAIGSAALQSQYERRREHDRVRAELGVSPDRKLVIVALTQLWEHNMLDREAHFAYVDRLFNLLSARDAKVLISLHPKMDPKHYLPRIEAAGLRCADRPLMEILTAADLFIGGGYSSTVRWAMAICIPCINLDLWGLDDSTYKDIPDFPTVRSWDAVERWLDVRLREDLDRQASRVPSMGLICDGQLGEKFVALVERMAERRS
jgi:hypothetical protein